MSENRDITGTGTPSTGTSGTRVEATIPAAPDPTVVTTSTTSTTGSVAPDAAGQTSAQLSQTADQAQDRLDVVGDQVESTLKQRSARLQTWAKSPSGRKALMVAGGAAVTYAVGRSTSKRRAAKAKAAKTNPIFRTLHDVGIAAWFGGTLMGAVGINGAAAEVDDPRQRARVANAGWARWTPANLAAIAAHLIGGAGILYNNKGRTRAQKGVAGWTAAKLGMTAAALGATAYSRVLGQQMMNAGDVPVEAGATPSAATPPEVQRAQKQLQYLQWAIPALTGGIVVATARMGEQQRPTAVLEGIVKKVVD